MSVWSVEKVCNEWKEEESVKETDAWKEKQENEKKEKMCELNKLIIIKRYKTR